MEQDLAFARHAIDRLGYGPRPGDLMHIASMGPDRWIESQLHPASIPLPKTLARTLDDLTTLRMTPAEAFLTYGPPSYRPPGGGKPTPEDQKAGVERARILPAEAIEARLLRALESPRQLEERLVEFWFNHFNVFVGKGLDRLWIGSYEEEAIRPHVLGKFRDLVGATAKHPAMLFYLDNWQNTAPNSPGARGNFKGLNENYARELMELHTLGVNGGYSQDDVVALARILTGWGFGGDGAGNGQPRRPGMLGRMIAGNPRMQQGAARNARQFRFNPERHDTGDKMLLGHSIKGRDGDRAVAEGEDALDLLVRAPATARHISFKLAQFFVADVPDEALVAAMTKTFQTSNGDIRAVMETLVRSAAFRNSSGFGTRFKTPYHYVVSSVRASGVPVRNIRPLYGTLGILGQPLFGCQTPDGFKCTEEAWLNADAMTRRISFAVGLGAGRLPLERDPGPGGLPVRRPERLGERMEKQSMMSDPTPADAGKPLDADAITTTLGRQFTANTLAVVNDAAPPLKAGLLLGSPEFMKG